ncbi:hypothetical protein ACNKHV_07300 [Shigella flexneri]
MNGTGTFERWTDWTFDLLDVYLAEIDRVANSTGWIPTRTRLK